MYIPDYTIQFLKGGLETELEYRGAVCYFRALSASMVRVQLRPCVRPRLTSTNVLLAVLSFFVFCLTLNELNSSFNQSEILG